MAPWLLLTLSKKMPIARHGNSLVVGGSSNSIPGILFSSPYVATELWIKSPLFSYFHLPPHTFSFMKKDWVVKKWELRFVSKVVLACSHSSTIHWLCFSILFQRSIIHRVFCLQQVCANVGSRALLAGPFYLLPPIQPNRILTWGKASCCRGRQAESRSGQEDAQSTDGHQLSLCVNNRLPQQLNVCLG